MLDISITKAEKLKEKPSSEGLGFGKVFTDHMFVMDYTEGQGWHDARIVPYQALTLDPSAMVFHYGQEMFEGLKAYRSPEGKVMLFRPDKNADRVNSTNDRLCIPQLPKNEFIDAVKAIVDVDKDWIPEGDGNSLYIRPFIIATDPFLGVRTSSTYKFIIILSPVGAYYKEGINPVKIWVEQEYVRAVKGGMGHTKTGGNYVASLKAQQKAYQRGFTQVLWLDGVHRRYVEEVGTMNVFFKINGKVVTPALNGSILPGVTRDSVIELLKTWGIPVEEKRIDIEELIEAAKNGQLEEAFGTGTAAVISPIGELAYNEHTFSVNNGEIGEVSQKLYDVISTIQRGQSEDKYGWTVTVD